MEKKIVNAVKKPFYYMAGKIFGIITLVLLLGCGIYFGQKVLWKMHIEKKHKMVEEQLSRCQELVTIKNRYTDVVSIKKTRVLGMAKAYAIVKFTAIIRAGIADINEIQVNVSKDARTLTLVLPKAEILGNDIISQEVFDEKKSIFVPLSTKEIFESIDDARKEMLEVTLENGILEDAEEQAKNAIKLFLSNLHFHEVEIIQKNNGIAQEEEIIQENEEIIQETRK